MSKIGAVAIGTLAIIAILAGCAASASSDPPPPPGFRKISIPDVATIYTWCDGYNRIYVGSNGLAVAAKSADCQ